MARTNCGDRGEGLQPWSLRSYTAAMKAWVMDGVGGPEVYRIAEMPIPEPGEGEVQVQVDGAGMNPVDWKIREGLYNRAPVRDFPVVALREFSGTVSKLGPGVRGWSLGD